MPYDVYVSIARECDFLRGQNSELRRLMDSLEVGPTREASILSTQVLSTPDVSIRARALLRIATRRMSGMTTVGDVYVDSVEMTRLTRWLVDELKLLGVRHE